MLHAFAKQLHDQMKAFLNNPIIEESLKADYMYTMLRAVLSHKMYQRKMGGKATRPHEFTEMILPHLLNETAPQ